MKTVVLIGNFSEGYRVVGPFEDHGAAAAWCDAKGLSTLDSWIASLMEPTPTTPRLPDEGSGSGSGSGN